MGDGRGGRSAHEEDEIGGGTGVPMKRTREGGDGSVHTVGKEEGKDMSVRVRDAEGDRNREIDTVTRRWRVGVGGERGVRGGTTKPRP